MATDVAEGGVTQPTAPSPPARPPFRAYPRRFAFVYGILGAATAAAIAGIVLAVTHTGVAGGGAAWSSWKPNGGGLGGATQIADHIGATYRLPNGDQLVDVIAKAPSVASSGTQAIPIQVIAIRGTGGRGDTDLFVSGSNTIQYSLCGLGTACSIASGTPSVARGTLVRREVLELALYTFKYDGGIQNVIAYMPPPAGQQAQYVVFLQRADVSAELKQPLTSTLAAKVPLPATIPAREVHLVDAVTEPRVYKYGLAQAQNGDAVLVLTPLPA